MKTISQFASSLLIVGLVSLPMMSQQSAPANNFVPQTQNEHRGDRERHPHIRTAIRELQQAKRELQTAAHDFGGHREDALKACDEAIKQLQQALQYDKK